MDLRDLAQSGATFELRVTPRARRAGLSRDADGMLRAAVTAAPEKGRANVAVRQMLAEALGVAPSRLQLVRGAGGRAKLYRLD
jgi:uncharacterized protein YggU (UPF0235/DUF167 family)